MFASRSRDTCHSYFGASVARCSSAFNGARCAGKGSQQAGSTSAHGSCSQLLFAHTNYLSRVTQASEARSVCSLLSLCRCFAGTTRPFFVSLGFGHCPDHWTTHNPLRGLGVTHFVILSHYASLSRRSLVTVNQGITAQITSDARSRCLS